MRNEFHKTICLPIRDLNDRAGAEPMRVNGVGVNFELFRQMLRLSRDATPGPWYVSSEFEDGVGTPCVSVGPHEGDHYEETIGQFLGGEHNHLTNAAFVAFVASHVEDMCVEIEKMKRIIDGVEQAALTDDFGPLVDLLSEINSEKGFKVIKPRSEDQRHPSGNTRLFLAGSIDNGAAEDWQARLEAQVKEFPVTVYNPRRDDWNPDLRQDICEPEFAYQVNWELDNIEAADVVFMYFSPSGPAPISLLELGSLVNKKADVIVCCPEGYWRRGNVQIVCHRSNFELYDDLDMAMKRLAFKLGNRHK